MNLKWATFGLRRNTVPQGRIVYARPQFDIYGSVATAKSNASYLLGAASGATCLLLVALAYSSLSSPLPEVSHLTLPLPNLHALFEGDKTAEYASEKEASGAVHYVSEIIRGARLTSDASTELAKSIVEESARAQVDPLFVAAVIKSESRFQNQARSGKGARGLMQILPDTGRFISTISNEKWQGASMLNNTSYNLQLGIAYLKHLEQTFRGNMVHTLVAYNWGPANLSEALSAKKHIPASTIQYARTVLAHHEQWKKDFTARKKAFRFMDDESVMG